MKTFTIVALVIWLLIGYFEFGKILYWYFVPYIPFIGKSIYLFYSIIGFLSFISIPPLCYFILIGHKSYKVKIFILIFAIIFIFSYIKSRQVYPSQEHFININNLSSVTKKIEVLPVYPFDKKLSFNIKPNSITKLGIYGTTKDNKDRTVVINQILDGNNKKIIYSNGVNSLLGKIDKETQLQLK